jgi:zinc protease
MEDLKAWHGANLAPNISRFRAVGDIDQAQVKAALADLGGKWQRKEVKLPAFPRAAQPREAKLYFYDVPGAKQSIFAFGHPGPARGEPDFYPAVAMNYILGGGSFASRLTQQLREGKGYTYGIFSDFSGGAQNGTFRIQSGVRANVTLEAAELTRSIMRDYATTFSEADLAVTKSFLTKSRARAFETAGAKLNYLATVGEYGLPLDYPQREQAIVDALTVDRVNALAENYVRPAAMTYVVVGDAATQAARLEGLGLGKPVMVKEAFDQANR